MTREAKIGLLVALAFLLVIGILLSDHVTTATREPGAELASVEGSIKGSMGAPGATRSPPIHTPPVLPQSNPAAETSVFAYQPPAAPSGGAVDVQVGQVPAGANVTAGAPIDQPPVLAAANPGTDPWGNSDASPETAPETAPPAGGAQAPLTIGGAMLVGAATDSLTGAAKEAGQPVVPVTGSMPVAAPTPASNQVAAGVKEYKIQPGDSLSKITAKFLGRDNPANREVIYSLNPKLKAQPNKIVVGQTCHVPATAAAAESLRPAGSAAARPDSSGVAPSKPNRQADRTAERTGQVAAAERKPAKTYTVKAGDTLWSIAAKQLGSGARHKEILKLNAEKIGGADEIKVGMKLKLP